MEEAANVDLRDEWDKLLENGIPMHKWSRYLKEMLERRVKGKVKR
jgi:hypothetical protein